MNQSVKTHSEERNPGSFRDPSGFVFSRGGLIYRQVNQSYKDSYDHLMLSGLYQHLVQAGLLISHSEVGANMAFAGQAYKVLQPEVVSFVSYPYEWCFSQLKEAALLTLEIQKRALNFGMSLKDCSAYNIQFVHSRPVLIDTLSFEIYREGSPWVPYRQFCEHFLAPLALMSYTDVRLNRLTQIYIDGIPLDMAVGLLPLRSRFNFALLLHLHIHSKSQNLLSHSEMDKKAIKRGLSKRSFSQLVENLESAIRKLKWKSWRRVWGDYYQNNSYGGESFEHKKRIVVNFLERTSPSTVWDLGANTGLFSRIASERGIFTVSYDNDPEVVEKNYRQLTRNKETNLLPLIIDFTSPSPSLGWGNRERISLLERGPVDAILALAFIHHLAISHNLPLGRIADLLSQLCNWLLIEFVPKSDPKVRVMLSMRDDVFSNYGQECFESEFGKFFIINSREPIKNTQRVVYSMERKQQ